MANIKLKDAFGAETVFHGIKQLKIPDADGGAAEFNLEAMTQEKTVEIIQNGTTEILPDEGYDGLSKVTVNVDVKSSDPQTQIKRVDLHLTSDSQTVTPDENFLLSSVIINKPATLKPENIKDNIDVAGVVGTLKTDGGNSGNVADWGDAAEDGSVIISPDKVSIHVYGKYGDNKPGGPDNNYAGYLRNELAPSQVGVSAALDAWAAELMTSGTAANNAFNAIFSGCEKAIFMGDPKRGICDVPRFTDADSKNFNGLLDALRRCSPADTLNALTLWWNYDPKDCVTAYDGSFDYNFSSKVNYPFFWVPAKSGGSGVVYCNIQSPSGEMPAFDLLSETGIFPFHEIGILPLQEVNMILLQSNSNVGIEKPCVIFNSVFTFFGVAFYSYGTQTIPAEILKEIIGVNTAVTVPEGWSILDLFNEIPDPATATAKTEAEIQEVVQAAHGFDPDIYLSTGIVFSSKDMFGEEKPTEEDLQALKQLNAVCAYAHSLYTPVMGETYIQKPTGQRFEMNFSLCENNENTN